MNNVCSFRFGVLFCYSFILRISTLSHIINVCQYSSDCTCTHVTAVPLKRDLVKKFGMFGKEPEHFLHCGSTVGKTAQRQCLNQLKEIINSC